MEIFSRRSTNVLYISGCIGDIGQTPVASVSWCCSSVSFFSLRHAALYTRTKHKDMNKEQAAELISSLMELRKEHREMVIANHNHYQSGEVRNFKHVDPIPFGSRDMQAIKDLIEEAETQVRLAVV